MSILLRLKHSLVSKREPISSWCRAFESFFRYSSSNTPLSILLVTGLISRLVAELRAIVGLFAQLAGYNSSTSLQGKQKGHDHFGTFERQRQSKYALYSAARGSS